MVLRKSLRLAIRAGLWRGRVEEVIPVCFSPEYEPRRRFLTADEVARLLAELAPAGAARVAFIVATSACWRETELALTEDVSLDLRSVLLRGTKRKTRFRTVPIVSPAQRSLIEHALRYAAGKGEALFQPWRNARRDILVACERPASTLRPTRRYRQAGQMLELGWMCLGAESNHRHGDFQTPGYPQQDRDFTPLLPVGRSGGSAWVVTRASF